MCVKNVHQIIWYESTEHASSRPIDLPKVKYSSYAQVLKQDDAETSPFCWLGPKSSKSSQSRTFMITTINLPMPFDVIAESHRLTRCRNGCLNSESYIDVLYLTPTFRKKLFRRLAIAVVEPSNDDPYTRYFALNDIFNAPPHLATYPGQIRETLSVHLHSFSDPGKFELTQGLPLDYTRHWIDKS